MAPAEPQDARVQELVEMLQVYILPRRVRTMESFKNFDKLNCGRCTVAQFGRGLNNIGPAFSDAEVDLLATHYTDSQARAPQVVRYTAFCLVVDSVFSEGVPPREVSSAPSSTAAMTFIGNDLSTEEESRLSHVLHRLAALCESRGVVFKYCFIDHDRGSCASPSRRNPHGGGKVTRGQFMRNFPFQRDFTHADMELLCSKYSSRPGDVHFMALHNDISDLPRAEPQPFPSSPLHLRPDESEWSHQNMEVIEKLRCKVVEKRLRVMEYFHDFDPLRKGFCATSQMKTVLSILNLSKEINSDHFRVLCEHYCRDDGMFNFVAFSADLETGFAVPGLEKDPLAVVPMPDATTTAAARRNIMTIVPERQKKLGAVMEKIQTWVHRRRLLMRPTFSDMDKTRAGVISKHQFARALRMLDLPVNEAEVDVLCNRYCNRGNHHTVDYKLFIQEMDPPDEAAQMAIEHQTEPVGPEAREKRYFDFHGNVIPQSSDAHPLPAGW